LMSVSAVGTATSTAFSPLLALTTPRSVLTLSSPFVPQETSLRKTDQIVLIRNRSASSLDICKLPSSIDQDQRLLIGKGQDVTHSVDV
jgi:hypothetical protein